MILSEEEAKTKWCPQTRWVLDSVGNGHTNQPNSMATGCCIASQCMAWRWEHEYEGAPAQYVGLSTTRGRCGLAGAP